MQPLWDILLRSRAFWLSYISAATELSGCPSLESDKRLIRDLLHCDVILTFRIGGQSLLLRVDAGEHHLALSPPYPAEDIPLGRMDCYYAMNELFRWDEFEAIARGLAKESGRPLWSYALLLSYYVAVTKDGVAAHSALLRRCLIQSKVFGEEEIEYIVGYKERNRTRGLHWEEVPELGWVVKGCTSSERCTRDGFSPQEFAALNAFLAAVQSSY